MIQGRKRQVPNVHPMLLLNNTSIWSSSTCEIEKFSLAQPNAFGSRCFSPHTHTICTYTIYTIRKSMIQGRKWQVPNVHPMLLFNSTSVNRSRKSQKRRVSLARPDAFCSRCLFPHTHRQKTHTLYIPFESLRSKEENDGCKMVIRCFCSMIRVFEAQVLAKSRSFARAIKCIVFKMFILAHTHKTHTLYIPFESLQSKEENDGCKMVIQCFCSIIRAFEA